MIAPFRFISVTGSGPWDAAFRSRKCGHNCQIATDMVSSRSEVPPAAAQDGMQSHWAVDKVADLVENRLAVFEPDMVSRPAF